jgi:DNA mismatch repair protein MutS
VISRARQVMGQIEKHSKIALGLRQGIEPIQPKQDSEGNILEQLDIFEV